MNLDDTVVCVWLVAGFDKPLHYRVPASMREMAKPGVLARVPLGRRQSIGLIVEAGCEPDLPLMNLKLVMDLVFPTPIMTPPLLRLAAWLRQYYGASIQNVLETMIPGPVRQGMRAKMEKWVSAAEKLDAEGLASLRKRAPKQAELYEFIAQQFRPQKKSLVLNRLGSSPAAYKALLDKGLIKEEQREVERVAYDDELGNVEYASKQEIVLNDEQQTAYESVAQSLDTGSFVTHLLFGVTGSGKTEVYIAAMEKALKAGRSVLFLVPEVALTPQTVGRLRSRFSDQDDVHAVVWHSSLSDGERLDAWMALADGSAKVVVGARSAVFAPMPNLGLVIVDEEHEPAFKQDETPRYHGRDVAVYRAFLENVVCVLGSATPSLETYRNVKRGKYKVDRLTKRIDDRQLPMMHVVDMRTEMMRTRKPTTLSSLLAEKLRDRWEKGEQSILFINRRGYNSTMLCPECGHVEECKHCSVPMTFHRSDNTLKCHLCGHEADVPWRCPSCNSEQFRGKGSGTQRIEDVVQKVLPKARIVRIDTDTMGRKHLFREILGGFRKGKIDVLVGTQMIAKGLDFPNVTLVGMVDADLSLHVPDFRANERTFQLLVQVSGRAGRGDLAGEVVVQTYTPHAEPIQFARRGEVDTFLDIEFESREQFQYPPFRHLVRQVFRSRNADKAMFFAEQFARKVEARMAGKVELRGPTPCSIEKMKDHYRYHIWYFTQNVSGLMRELKAIEAEVPVPKDVIYIFDVDPMSVS
ncbi:primosomal protein N' [Pelagicoccus sp. SDUM812003]|uniref:replication restart helicase PriA n=1 Tax=Pelagicoccus sp. SDUM812003 TaxID=3041267 RepID=UPI00280ED887|nr:primosomal protein N' [Pelagicoccus sp. SDUM812003]MDQ8201555.1 primosomal protein N' [Pelagicoccus sp. SDUM812003]